MATPAPEGLRAAFDPDNQDSEVIALFLGSPNANRILVNAFDLAAALARLEDGTDQDPFFSPMSAEGISTNTVELEGGPDPTSGYSPESSVPVEASYMAGEVETIEPGGVMLLRRVWYPGEDTLEITGPRRVQGNRGIQGNLRYLIRRQKPGPVGKAEVRAALLEEHCRTGASARSLARKYGVSNGTAWRWVYGRRSQPKRLPEPRYPYPLPDGLWERLEPLVQPKAKGAPPRYARRSIVEAIFRILREGRPWEEPLPGYPPGKMVYWHYRNWVSRGVWAEVEGVFATQAVGMLRRGSGG